MTKRFLTGEVRASFLNVFSPKLNEMSGNEEYSMMLLIPKSDKVTLAKFEKGIKEALSEKFGANQPSNWRYPLRDGDIAGDRGVSDGTQPGAAPYGGHYFINIKSKTKPGVVDQSVEPIIDSSEFVSGDYCRVSVRPYAYDMKGNKGVAFGLGNVQFARKGEPLGGEVRAEDEFGIIDPSSIPQTGEVASQPSFL